MGMSAVRISLGAPIAPFFRFPALKHPRELLTYLGERTWVFFRRTWLFRLQDKKPEQVITNVLNKLRKFGKGIVLVHDFQPATRAPCQNFCGGSSRAVTRLSTSKQRACSLRLHNMTK